MNSDLNQQAVISIASEKIVSNTNKPLKTVAKKLNKFLIKTHFSDETKLLIAISVMSGIIYT